MTQLLEFIGNHPVLCGALAAVVFMMIASEMRRKLVGAIPLSAKQSVALINNDNALIVDLRAEAEFQNGHIISAINASEVGIADNPELVKHKDKPIVIVCQSGAKSQHASAALKKAGFTSLYFLKGGILSWTQDNLPLEK